MRKCISIILTIFICFNFISVAAGLTYEVKGIESQSAQTSLGQETRASRREIKNIAVFIKFSGNKEANHIDDPECVQNAEKIFNSNDLFDMESVNGTIKVPSFKKYYETQSYGNLSIETKIFPKVNGNVTSYVAPNSIYYYLKYNADNPDGYKNDDEKRTRERELVQGAIDHVKTQIEQSGINASELDTSNDGKVDAISFFVEGEHLDTSKHTISWSDLLWAHKSDDKNIGRDILGKSVEAYNLIYVSDYKESVGTFSLNRGTYGTIIHEFGHTLGYMDLYRHGGSNNNPVGFYDVMGEVVGSNPQNFLTYFITDYRPDTNWHSPLETITKTTKSITLNKPEFKDRNEKRAIKIVPNSGSKEYFIVEYHEKQNTYDTHRADESGIIVYRVNDNNKFHGNVSRRVPRRAGPRFRFQTK